MLKQLAVLLLMFGIYSCAATNNKKALKLESDVNYPQWIINGEYQTKQTSGISFIGLDSLSNRNFLLADDIGFIHRLVLSNDSIAAIIPVNISTEALNNLPSIARKDFEEISIDKYSGKVYLSQEGNNPDPIKSAGIFQLIFAGNNVYSDSIVAVEKLDIKPHELFNKYLRDNIAYEGFAADEKYFYLGLEGFSENNVFADSTMIFIVDKSTLEIVKQVSTKEYNIHTICGLYSDDNFSLWGVDRNNRKLFRILFDESLSVRESFLADIPTNIPGYISINYVASLESVTMDENGELYIVDDPWTRFFVPSEEVLAGLDSATVNNFKRIVPVLYKFKVL